MLNNLWKSLCRGVTGGWAGNCPPSFWQNRKIDKMYLTRNIHDFSSLISYRFDGVIFLSHYKSLSASLSSIWRYFLRLFVSICTDRLRFEYFHTMFSRKKSCKCFTHRTLQIYFHEFYSFFSIFTRLSFPHNVFTEQNLWKCFAHQTLTI